MTTDAERRTAARPEKEARHRAREAAVQMLYQWEVGRDPISDVVSTFWAHGPSASQAVPGELRTFATMLANGVARTGDALDPVTGGAAGELRVERMKGLAP